MTLEQVSAALEEVRAKRQALLSEIYKLEKLERKLMLEIARTEYTCNCVMLNEEIGVFTMTEQEARGRKALGLHTVSIVRADLTLGLVCETLSAVKQCTMCHGTGKPQ
jgi:hypothetical protein